MWLFLIISVHQMMKYRRMTGTIVVIMPQKKRVPLLKKFSTYVHVAQVRDVMLLLKFTHQYLYLMYIVLLYII